VGADVIELLDDRRAVALDLLGDAPEVGHDGIVVVAEVSADDDGGAVHRHGFDHDHRGTAPRPLAVVAEVALAGQALLAHVRRVRAEDDAVLQREMAQGQRRKEMREGV